MADDESNPDGRDDERPDTTDGGSERSGDRDDESKRDETMTDDSEHREMTNGGSDGEAQSESESSRTGSSDDHDGAVDENSKQEQLDDVRENPDGQELTTDHGVAISDTDNSLKATERGPTLMEDFHFREKMTQFDHESIPERVVHARGRAHTVTSNPTKIPTSRSTTISRS